MPKSMPMKKKGMLMKKKGKKLKGNQKKLDMNKNGRLDKQDFAMMRAKRKKGSQKSKK
jgi:hypothetical protein